VTSGLQTPVLGELEVLGRGGRGSFLGTENDKKEIISY
jgi:hypothetical protein